MTIRFLSYLILTLVVALSLLFFSKPLADGISRLFGAGPEAPRLQQTGQLVEALGHVTYKRKTSSKFQTPGALPLALYHQDMLATGRDSLARIILSSGAELSLTDSSEILIEFFNPSDALSPVYITIRRGLVDVRKPGVAGRLFFIRNRKLVAPSQLDQREHINTIVTNPTAPAKTVEIAPRPRLSTQDTPKLETPEISEDLRTALANEQPIVKIGNKETLSSRYIESVFATKSSQFRRCQINSLRDRENALGRLLFSLTILPSGKVRDVKLLSGTATSRLLQSCVKDIIERSAFEKFSGDEITLSYPIDFQ